MTRFQRFEKSLKDIFIVLSIMKTLLRGALDIIYICRKMYLRIFKNPKFIFGKEQEFERAQRDAKAKADRI